MSISYTDEYETENQTYLQKNSNFFLKLFSYFLLLIFLLIYIVSMYYTAAHILTFFIDVPYFHNKISGITFIFSFAPAAVLSIALWSTIRFQEELPKGVYLDVLNNRNLIREVNKLAHNMGTPSPDLIVITEETNAFAAEIAETGILGNKTKVLGLGLPLLSVLSKERAMAVIAHEMGHFSKSDASAGLVHNLLMTTGQIVVETGEQPGAFGIVMTILGYPTVLYMKIASIIQSKVSRINEFSADQKASQYYGKQNTADALSTLHIAGTQLDQLIWEPLKKAWLLGEALPDDVMSTIDKRVVEVFQSDMLEKRFEKALQEETNKWDSHPCLSDRIKALDVPARMPKLNTNEPSATHVLFGDKASDIRSKLNKVIYHKHIAEFAERQQAIEELNDLVDHAYPLIDEAPDPKLAANILSMLMSKHLAAEKSKHLHQDLTDRFGYLPGSASLLAQVDLAEKSIRGADTMLKLAEQDIMMQGDCHYFLSTVYQERHNLNPKLEWLEEWINDEHILSEIERVCIQAEATVTLNDTIWDKPYELAPTNFPNWFNDFLVKQIRKTHDAVNIWLATKISEDEKIKHAYAILVEIPTSNAQQSAEVPLNSMLVFPSTSFEWIGDPLFISQDKDCQRLRECDWALIS